MIYNWTELHKELEKEDNVVIVSMSWVNTEVLKTRLVVRNIQLETDQKYGTTHVHILFKRFFSQFWKL